jgi:hypothetical protein
LLSVKTGGIAEVTQKTDPIVSVRLDLEHQTLAQTGLAEILRPLAYEQVTSNLHTYASRPDGDLVGVARGRSRNYQLVSILRKLFANRRHNSSVLFLLDLRVPLIDPAQNDLIEPEIAGRGRIVSVPTRSEIEMCFA